MIKLDEDEISPTKDQHYWAQIAVEVRRTIAKHPEKLMLKDFILKWVRDGEQQKEETQEEIQQENEASYEARRAAWFGSNTQIAGAGFNATREE